MKKGSSHRSLLKMVTVVAFTFSFVTGANARDYTVVEDYSNSVYGQCDLSCENELRQTLRDLEGSRDFEMLPQALNDLGVVVFKRKKYKTAQALFARAVKISSQSDDKFGEAVSYLNLGIVLRKQGRRSEALDKFRQSMRVTRGTKAHVLRVNALFQYGRLMKEQNNIVWARKALGKAKYLSRKHGFKHLFKVSYRALDSMSDVRRRRVLAVKSDKPVRRRLSASLRKAAVSKVAVHVVKAVQRVSMPAKVIQKTTRVMDDADMAKMYDQLGVSHMELRQYDMASEMFQKSIFLNGQMKNKVAQANGYHNLAKIYVKLGDHKNSCVNLWKARELMTKAERQVEEKELTTALSHSNCLLQQAALEVQE